MLCDIQTVSLIKSLCHLLELPTMTTTLIYSKISQIVMYHFMHKYIFKLLWGEVIIVRYRDTEIKQPFAKPDILIVTMEIATRPEWVQQVKLRDRQFVFEISPITLIEGICHVHQVCDHILLTFLISTTRPYIVQFRSITIPTIRTGNDGTAVMTIPWKTATNWRFKI